MRAGVESLFQAKVWSRLNPAPFKPYQDIQALVLMAGKVAVCLLDSYRREGGQNNGLLLFACSSSERLERIFMCCCRRRILWPDPALSCAAVRHTQVAPGPGSASRWGNGTLLPESRPNGFFWKCQNPPGSLSLRQGTRGSAACVAPGLGPPRRLAPLGYLLFIAVSFPPPKALPSPAFRHVRKKANKALGSRAEQAPRWLRGEQAARPPAVPLPEMPPSPGSCICGRAGSWPLGRASLCRAALTWELSSASFFSTHHPSCKRLSVLRPGCQNLQLPTQALLEPFCVRTKGEDEGAGLVEPGEEKAERGP